MDIIIDTPVKELKQTFNCHACQKSHPDAMEAKKCFENHMGNSKSSNEKDEIKDSVEPIESVKGKLFSFRGHGKLKSMDQILNWVPLNVPA